ncbi:MAG: MATE family efflux transporter [Lachnospirales bacterium]
MEKSLNKTYLHTAIPASVEAMLLILLSAVDIAMIGHIDKVSLTAVAIFTQPRLIILCFPKAMAVAVTARISHLIGEDNESQVIPFFKQSLFAIGIVGIVLTLLSYIFLNEILLVAGAKSDFINLSISYGRICLVSIFINMFSLIIGAALTAILQTKYVLYAGVIGNIVNIILNAIFIYGLGLGVVGAAIGTVIGSFVTLCILLYLVVNNKSRLCIKGRENWKIEKSEVFITMPMTIVTFMELAFERIGMFLYTRLVMELGVTVFAAHTIAMNVCDFFYCFGQGFSKASLVLAGRAYAKKDEFLKKEIFSLSMKYNFFFGTIGCLIYLALKGIIPEIYSNDVEVNFIAESIIVFVAFVSIPEMFNLTFSGILRGTGQMKYVAKYSLISITIVRPIITYMLCFPLGLGVYGAWIALFIDQSTRGTCAYLGARYKFL